MVAPKNKQPKKTMTISNNRVPSPKKSSAYGSDSVYIFPFLLYIWPDKKPSYPFLCFLILLLTCASLILIFPLFRVFTNTTANTIIPSPCLYIIHNPPLFSLYQSYFQNVLISFIRSILLTFFMYLQT